VKVISLDAGGWTDWSDFYDALFAGLGSPHWHGKNLDALIDSMIHGGINEIEPPYRIVVANVSKAGAGARSELAAAIMALGDAGGTKEGIEFKTDSGSAVWVPRISK
jgi:RNAse (barnase) inhibitor barstar